MFKTFVGALFGRGRGGVSCVPKRHRASLSTSKMCWTARVIGCHWELPNLERVFATKSHHEILRFAHVNLSRWKLNSSAIPISRSQWYQVLARSSNAVVPRTWAFPISDLIMREHHKAELAHYSVGTADIEYAFPFMAEGEYGELEGIAHRGDFDLRSHMEGKLDETIRSDGVAAGRGWQTEMERKWQRSFLSRRFDQREIYSARDRAVGWCGSRNTRVYLRSLYRRPATG